MTCEEMRPLVSALVDGELSGEETVLAREHLAACSACRSLEEELEATSTLVARHGQRPSFDELSWTRFERALAKEKRSGWSGLLGLAALVALTGLLSLLLVVTQPGIPTYAIPRRQLPIVPYADPAPVAANVPPCPKDLAGVENAAAARALTVAQRTALERDGFVQVPGDGAAFSPREAGGAGALVTADAAFLVYGGAVSRAVLEVEREQLAPGLRATLEHLHRVLGEFQETAADETAARGARLASRIVQVASVLDGGASEEDRAVREDVEKAEKALGRSPSAVLARDVDWTRFAPRGVLRELPGHFRAVVWLGEASLALDADDPDELRAASLIALALAREPRELGRWADFDDAVSLIHGPQDDLGALEMLSVLRGAIGDSVRPALVGREEALALIARRAREVAKTERAGSIARLEGAAPRFRLVGSSRSLEELVISELSGDKLPGRPRPTSLDLLAAIGSTRARAIASNDGTPGYGRALDRLSSLLEEVTKVPRAVARSGSGVERARLFAIAKLVERPRDDAAPFAKTEAYEDRLLMAALAALDTPDPGGDGELVADPEAPLPAVEPLPGVYARLAHGARRLALGLETAAPAASRATARLKRVSDLLAGLAHASQEQLEGVPFSPEARLALQSFASAARVYAPASAFAAEDVHVLVKSDGSREWLERTTGPLDRLWIVLPGEEGKLRLVSGPALSAREAVSQGPLTKDDVARAARLDPSWASHVVR